MKVIQLQFEAFEHFIPKTQALFKPSKHHIKIKAYVSQKREQDARKTP